MSKKSEISPDEYYKIYKKYSIYPKEVQYTQNYGENNAQNYSYNKKDSQNIKEKIKLFLESL